MWITQIIDVYLYKYLYIVGKPYATYLKKRLHFYIRWCQCARLLITRDNNPFCALSRGALFDPSDSISSAAKSDGFAQVVAITVCWWHIRALHALCGCLEWAYDIDRTRFQALIIFGKYPNLCVYINMMGVLRITLFNYMRKCSDCCTINGDSLLRYLAT